MSPVTGLARLAGRSLPSVHSDMRNFSKVRELRFQPGYCSYGKISSLVTEISVAKTDISVSGPARLLI